MQKNQILLARVVCAAIVCASLVPAASADMFGTGSNRFKIDFVTISGATNPASGYGIVNNDYRIGVYEITNYQWDRFTAASGVPTGTPSNAYDANPYFTGAKVPANEVSWYEAAQFVNWLNTSTGHQAAYKFFGTRTTGYTLATWSAAEADNGTNLYRHKDAFYYLPTEHEWVKAAYWNGTDLQTYSNASADDLVSWGPDPAKWNYSPSAGDEPWDVGSGVEELNGTFDIMGNVMEWMESPYSDTSYGADSNRATRGGSYFEYYDYYIASPHRTWEAPNVEGRMIGFRVASEVPEPASLVVLSVGALCLRRRKGWGPPIWSRNGLAASGAKVSETVLSSSFNSMRVIASFSQSPCQVQSSTRQVSAISSAASTGASGPRRSRHICGSSNRSRTARSISQAG